MRLRSRGLQPRSESLVVSTPAVRTLAFGLIGVGLSACATTEPPRYAGVYVPPAQTASAETSRQGAAKADLEADGRPAQLPPARRPLPEEDDPTQPWSPNYGRQPGTYETPIAPPARTASLSAKDEAIVAPMGRSRNLSAAEADAVILRAIQAHETRKP